jgi:hypothetical protein
VRAVVLKVGEADWESTSVRRERRLQNVYGIGGDVDLELLEAFKEDTLQADEESPIRLRVWHIHEQADEVFAVLMHSDTTHGGG